MTKEEKEIVENQIMMGLQITFSFSPELKDTTDILEDMLATRKAIDYCQKNPTRNDCIKCLISYQFQKP